MVVVTRGGISATSPADVFTYVSQPVVSGVSPNEGPVAGGTSVTITGGNLTGATEVDFGSTPATGVVVSSDTQITATAPSGTAGTVDVTVMTAGGTSEAVAADEFTYVALPSVSGVSPAVGPTTAGTVVTLTGTAFTAATSVFFGSAAATSFTVLSDTQITATAPAGSPGSVDVTVTTAGGTSTTGAADRFTYVPMPTVTRVVPAKGSTAGGTVVTVTGTDLTGATAVKFGSAVALFTVDSATRITASSPVHALGTVDVTVTTAGGTSATSSVDHFGYIAPPVVSKVTPSSGPATGGTAVTIEGSGFAGAESVRFGTAGAEAVRVRSATEITVTAPPAVAGEVDVTVSSPMGSSTPSAADRFTYVAPAAAVGYWLVASDGGIFSYGDADFYGSTGSLVLNKPIVGMASTPDGRGYWLVASDGGIFSYGDADFYGSTGSLVLNKPIVGMASTPDGRGYWLVATDGGVFAFGDAGFFGSAGSLRLNKAVVGMAATGDGHGYWLVASDGGIFTYGDASFDGSAGDMSLNKPIVGMAPMPDGRGYWLVASDGGIFSYGEAPFYGSTGSLALDRPIVGVQPTREGGGYWLVASDGGIFSYGDALYEGSTGGLHLNAPVVGMSAGV